MKLNLFIILMLLSFFQQEKHYTLTINIKNLRSNKGHIIMDFKNNEDKSIKAIYGNIQNKKCVIEIENLNPGKYSYRYFHDENDNKNIEFYWFGAPKEGYGFSNNTGMFGIPAFWNTLFTVNSDTTQTIKPFYIEF